MNILALGVLIELIVFSILGYKKGLIKTIFSIFSIVIALVLTLIITPQVSIAIQKNDTITESISGKVEQVLHLDELSDHKVQEAVSIESLPLPKVIKESLLKNNTKEGQAVLGVSSFTDYLSHSVANMVINALSFVVVFITLLILLKVLCAVLDIISKLPVLKQINRLSGLVAGFVKGVLILWIASLILVLFSSSEIGKSCYKMINESEFLSYIYNNNLLVKYITNIFN